MVKLSPESGLKVLDGTVVVGRNTSDVVFTTPEDVGFKDIPSAEELIKTLNTNNAYGHNDWRLPNDDEKKLLLSLADKGALSGTFNAFRASSLIGMEHELVHCSATHPDRLGNPFIGMEHELVHCSATHPDRLGNPLIGMEHEPTGRSISSCYLSSDDLTRFSEEQGPKNKAVQLETNDGARFVVDKRGAVQFFIRPVRNGPMPV